MYETLLKKKNYIKKKLDISRLFVILKKLRNKKQTNNKQKPKKGTQKHTKKIKEHQRK